MRVGSENISRTKAKEAPCSVNGISMTVVFVVLLSLFTLACTEGRTPRSPRAAGDEGTGIGSDTALAACLNKQLVVLDSRLLEQNDVLDSRLIEQNAALDNRLQAQNADLDSRFYDQQVALDTVQRQNQALDERLVKLHPTLDTRLLELVTLMDTRLQALHTDTVSLLDTRLQEQHKATEVRFLEQKAAFDALHVLNTALESRLMEVETAVNSRLLALSADVLKLADTLGAHKAELNACVHAQDAVISSLKNNPPPLSTGMDYRLHALDQELGSVKRTLTQQNREITSLRNLTTETSRLRQGVLGFNSTPAGQSSVESARERPVAFTARFSSESLTALPLGHTLAFDNVVYNQGSGYNLTSGLLTAPSSGTYVFYLQVMRHKDDQAVHADIYTGETMLARASGCCSSYGTGTAMVTQRLTEGQTVHVRINHGSSLFGDMYTSFSGFQLADV